MRKNAIYKIIAIMLAVLTILSVGASAFAQTESGLPTTIEDQQTQPPVESGAQPGNAPAQGPIGTKPQTSLEASSEPSSPQPDAAASVAPENTDISLATIADLQKIGVDPAYPLDGTYLLANDIDGKQADGTNAILAPIGSIDTPFTGTINGGGHKISNIEIKNEDVFASHSGLFTYFDGTVTDLALTDIHVTGNTAGVFAAVLGGNAQISGLFITGSVQQPVFPEDTDREIPAFVAGGLAGSAEVSDDPANSPQKIENTAVFASVTEQGTQAAAEEQSAVEVNKQLGAWIGSNNIPADKFANNIWSSAYGEDTAFGIDSPVNAADGVVKIETSPTYLALMAGQSGVLSANEKAGEAYGLAFKGWETDKAMASLSSETDKDVTVTAGQTIGVANVAMVYERTWADDSKTEVRFVTPVIISQMIDEEKKLEPVDPVFPTQIDEVKPLEPVDDVFPTILSETVPLEGAGAVNEISTWEQFKNIGNTEYNAAYTMDADYVLCADIIAEEGDFAPIGTEENPFSGTFDGKDYTFDLSSNTNIDKNQMYYGLFGTVKVWEEGEIHPAFADEAPTNPMVPERRIKNLYVKSDLEIVVQACDQEVVPNQKVEFSIAATDLPNVTYQWQESTDDGQTWNDIAGATDYQYMFNAQGDESQDGNQYRCKVGQEQSAAAAPFALFSMQEPANTVYSDPVVLTVDANLYAKASAKNNPNFYMDGWSTYSTNEDNRAMVWFGNFNQYGGGGYWTLYPKQPVLNRVLLSDDNKITMLTEYMMSNSKYSWGQMSYYDKDGNSSILRQNIMGKVDQPMGYYGNAISQTEDQLLLPTYLAPINAGYGEVAVTDKVFPLSKKEVTNTRMFPNGNASRAAIGTPNSSFAGSFLQRPGHDMWWLRDAGTISSFNGRIDGQGVTASTNTAYRPAMNLDANKVTLVAANNTGGAPGLSSTLVKTKGEAVDRNRQWQLPYGSNSQTFRVFQKDNAVTFSIESAHKLSSNSVQISYRNASASSANYLGALLVNKDTHEKYVARTARISSSNGSVTLTLPSESMGADSWAWELYLWNENESSRKTSQVSSVSPADFESVPLINNIKIAPGGWTTNKNVTFSVSDTGSSGINRVFWSDKAGQASGVRLYDKGNNTYKIEELYPIGENTVRTVYLVAYSNEGKRAETQVNVSNLDKVQPLIDNLNVTPQPDGASFVVSATIKDSGSGVNRAFVSKSSTATSGEKMHRTLNDGWETLSFIGEGNYYVIAYDQAGNRTVSRDYVTLEQTSPLIQNAAAVPGDWAQEKSISATVTDRSGVGIDRVFFSSTSGETSGTVMNGSNGVYLSNGGITKNGTYYVVAYSKDNKRTEAKVEADKIDRTNPVISDETIDGVGPYTVSALVTDVGGSGVDKVFISTDKNAQTGIPLNNISGDQWKTDNFTGLGNYYVIAYDKVGNRTVTNTPLRTLLPTPLIEDAKQDQSGWTPTKTISAKISDQSGFGLDESKIFYSKTPGATAPASAEYLLTNAGGGVYRSGDIADNGIYYIVAYDQYGGHSEAMVSVTMIDKEGPEVSNTKQSPTSWAQKKTISAVVIDKGIGVDRVFYSLDKNAVTGTQMTASGSIYSAETAANGTYYIIAYDIFGNRGIPVAVTVDKIDKEPPVVSDAKQDVSGGVIGGKTFSAVVTDNSASIKDVFYSSLSTGAQVGTPMTYSGGRYVSPKVTVNGTYYIYAVDVAGNLTPKGTPVKVSGILEPLGSDDPMWWMGQQADSKPDTNRAMVWFGNYWQQAGSDTKTPILWRTLKSDGIYMNGLGISRDDYGSSVILTSEYILHQTRAVWGRDLTPDEEKHGTYNELADDSPMRYWLNGDPAAGALDSTHLPGTVPAEGWNNPFYTTALNAKEQNLLIRANQHDTHYQDIVKSLTWEHVNSSMSYFGEPGGSDGAGDWTALQAIGTPMMTNNYAGGAYSDPRGTSTGNAAESVNGYVRYYFNGNIRNSDAMPGVKSNLYNVLSDGSLDLINFILYNEAGVRPLIFMDPSTVMFVPATANGGTPAVNTALTVVGGQAPTTWSLTPEVGGTTLRVFERGGDNAPSADITNTVLNNGKVRVSYENMAGGGDNYISVMVVNTTDRKKYVGRVLKATNPSGSVDVTLPAGVPADLSGYKLFSWMESETYQKINGITEEDPGPGPGDTDPPVISNAQQVPVGWSNAEKKITAMATDSAGVSEVYVSREATGALSGINMTNTGSNQYLSDETFPAGTYYIYARDALGNRNDAGVAVVVDQIDLVAPSITNAVQDKTETGVELVFTANVADTGSGIKEVYWSTQASGATSGTAMSKTTGDTYTSKNTNIGVTGTYYIYAVDMVGNRTTKGVPVILNDVTPPEISNPQAIPSGWATGKTISATVMDYSSGVREVYWSREATGALSGVPMKAEGNTYTSYATLSNGTYYIYAVDNANNRTATGVPVVVTQVDAQAPVITNAEQDMAKSTYGSAVFHATVTDADSGVKEVYWSMEKSSAATGTPMTDNGSGVYEATGITASGDYYIYAVDHVGNRTADGQWVHVEVQDFPSPVVFNARQEPTGWAKSKVIQAQVTDDVSAITKVFYSTEAENATTGEPMLLNAETGEYTSDSITANGTFYVYAENAKGYRNKKGVEVVVDQIDNEGPAITGAKTTPTGWTSAKQFEATVTDVGCGLDQVFVSHFSGAVAPAGDAYIMTKDGDTNTYRSSAIDIEGTYYVIAVDLLGNRTVSDAVVLDQIDTEGPEISNYRQSRSSTITAVAQLTDAKSGVGRAFISKDKTATEPLEDKYILSKTDTDSGSDYVTGPGIDFTAEDEYYFVIAYDNAGNRSVSEEFVVTEAWATGEPTITSNVFPDGWAQQKSVQATITPDTSVNPSNTILRAYMTTKGPPPTLPEDAYPSGDDIVLTKDANGYWVSNSLTENGSFTVIAVDSVGKIGIGSCPVIKIDRTPPVFGTPAQNEPGITAFKTASVDIMDGETGSGVERAFISTDPNATEAQSKEFEMVRTFETETWTTGEVRTEGTYVVIAYDYAGNRAVSETFQIEGIDPYPPEIKEPPMLKLGSAANTMVMFTDVTDIGSGVERAFISTDWTATSPVMDRDKGLYAYGMMRDGDTDKWQTGDIIEGDFVSYYIIAYDFAGNRSVTKDAYRVEKTDKTPPQIISAVQFPEGIARSKGIEAEVTDNMSGVKHVWYSDQFMSSTFTAENEMLLDAKTGKYKTKQVKEPDQTIGREAFDQDGTWYVYAEDNDGNITVRGTRVDITDIRDGDPVIISSVTVDRPDWTNLSVNVTARIETTANVAITSAYFSEDENAATGTDMTVKTVTQDPSANIAIYEATYTLHGTQQKIFYVNALGVMLGGMDVQAESRGVFSVKIDMNAPEITNITQEAVGAVTGDYAKARRISATVTDTGGSELSDVFITTNKNANLNADGTLPEGALRMTKQFASDTYKSVDITKTGDYYVIAYDHAGNKTTSAAPIKIEKIDTGAPEIGGFTHEPATSASAWGTVADYVLKATGITDDNGVAELWLGTSNKLADALKVDGYTAGTASMDIPITPGEGTTTYYLWAKDAAGNVSTPKTTAVYKDTLAPTVIVKEGMNGWQTFLNIVTFGFYYKDSTTFSIDVFETQPGDVNAVSGLKSCQYYVRTMDGKADELKETYDEFIAASKDWVWQDYTALSDINMPINPNSKKIVYAKAEDNAGNVAYVNSEGMVFDNAAPSFANLKQSSDKWETEKTIDTTVADVPAGISYICWSDDQNAGKDTGKDVVDLAPKAEETDADGNVTTPAVAPTYTYDYKSSAITAEHDATGKTYYVISEDNAGNRNVQPVTVNKIGADAEAPTVGAVAHTPATTADGYKNSEKFILNVTGIADAEPGGVFEIWYGTENDVAKATKYAGYTPKSATCDIEVTPADGATTYYVWAKDAIRFSDASVSTTIYKDSILPEITGGAQSSDAWAKSKTISATIKDSGSGIGKVFWSDDPDALEADGKNVYTAPAGTAEYTYTSGDIKEDIPESGKDFYIIAYDRAGNRSVQAVKVTKVDTSKPGTFTLTHVPASSSLNFISSGNFTLQVRGITDALSGAAEVWYSVKSYQDFAANDPNIAEAQRYSAYTAGDAACDIAISPEDGMILCDVWIKDAAGNISDSVRTQVYKDTQGPKWGILMPDTPMWENAESYTIKSDIAVDGTPGMIHPIPSSGVDSILIDSVPITTADQATAQKMTLTRVTTPYIGNEGEIELTPEKDGKLTYYIRAVDKAGNIGDQMTRTVMADRTAPDVTIKEGMNVWQSFLNIITFGLYYKDSATFTIEAEDPKAVGVNEVSGIASTQYYIREVTGGTEKVEETKAQFLEASKAWTWTDYTALSDVTIPASAGAQRVIYAKSTDVAGNVTYVNSQGMIFDNTPPEVGTYENTTVDPLWVNAAHTGKVSVKASAVVDQLMNGVASGLTHVYLMKNNTGTAAGDIAYELTASGADYVTNEVAQPAATTSYYLRAVDNAGNWNDASKSVEVKVQVDRDNPTYTLGIDKDSAANNYASQTAFELQLSGITDAISGPAEVWHGTQNDITKATKAAYTAGDAACNIAVTPPEGITTYYVWAKDAAGNAAMKSKAIYKDTKVPLLGTPSYGDAEWGTGADVKLTVPGVKDDTSASTDVSGVSKVLCDTKTIAAADQATATAMTLSGETATLTVTPPDGDTVYYIRVVDKAGNLSEEKTVTVKKDTTPPDVAVVLTTTQSVVTGDAFVEPDGSINDAYAKYTFAGFTEPADINFSTVFPDAAGAVAAWAKISDNGSGVPQVSGRNAFEIYFSTKALTKAEVAALPDSVWTNNANYDMRGMMDCGAFPNPATQKEGKFVVYVRSKDNAGNWGYGSSQGYLVDRSNPTVSDLRYEKQNQYTADDGTVWSSHIKVSAAINDTALYTTGAAQSGVDADNIYIGNILDAKQVYTSMYGFPKKEADGRYSMDFDFWPDDFDAMMLFMTPRDLSTNTVLGLDQVNASAPAPGLANFFRGLDSSFPSWNKKYVLLSDVTNIDTVSPTVSNLGMQPAATSWSPKKTLSVNIEDMASQISYKTPYETDAATGKPVAKPDYDNPTEVEGSGLKEAFISTNKNANASDAGNIPVTLNGGKYKADIAKNGEYYLITIDNVGNRKETKLDSIGSIDFSVPTIGGITHEPLTGEGNFSNNESYVIKLTDILDAEPTEGEAKSGPAEVWFGTENDITKAQQWTGYTADSASCDITVTPPEGVTTYYIWVKDRAGNVSAVSSVTIYKDVTGPDGGDWEITWEDEDASTISLFGTVTWTNKKQMTVTIKNIKDNLSGVKQVNISDAPIASIADGQAMTLTHDTVTDTYTATITLNPPEGTTTYYVRAFDNANNMGTQSEKTTYRDYTAPTGTLKEGMNTWQGFVNAITFGLYYKDKTTFTIDSTDPKPDGVNSNSDLASTQYYIRELTGPDEGINETMDEFLAISKDWTWTNYGPLSSVELSIDPNIKRVVYVKITDNAGNTTYINSQGMIFDNTKPSVGTADDVAVDPVWVNIAHTGDVKVSAAKVEDVLSNNVQSGVAHAYLMKNNTGTAAADIACELTKSGTDYIVNVPQPASTTQYYLRVVDNAGNWNDPALSLPVALQIDKAAPAIADAKQNTDDWASEKLLSATVTDSDSADGKTVSSGIARIFWSDQETATSGNDEYTAPQGTKSHNYTATTPITETLDETGKTFYIISYDVAGNRTVQSVTVNKIDSTRPEIGGFTHEPLSAANGYQSSANFTLKLTGITDDTGGVSEVWYGTDADITKAAQATYTPDSAACDITVTPNEGITTYYVWVKDRTGNVSDMKSTTIYKDTKAPLMGAPAADETEWTNQKDFVFTVPDIRDDTSAAADVSGVAKMLYAKTPITAANQADAKEMALAETATAGTYTATVTETPTEQGELTYYFRALDKAGNLGAEQTVTIKVDQTAPQSTLKIGNDKWTQVTAAPFSTKYYNKAQAMVVDYTEDGFSEIVDFKYRIETSPMTEEQLKATTSGWKFFMNAMAAPNRQCYVYAYVKDGAGNVTYMGTDTLVFDDVKPVVGTADDMTITPVWVNKEQKETAGFQVKVDASAVADVTKDGVQSGVNHVYLMSENKKDGGEGSQIEQGIAYELSESGGIYTANIPAPDVTTTYYLRAIDKAQNWNDETLSVPVTVQIDLLAPAFADARQSDEGWKREKKISATVTDADVTPEGATEPLISSGISRIFWSDDETATSGSDEYTPAAGTVVKTYDYAPATLVKEDIGPDGKDFYIIAYDVAGNRSVQTVHVDKVDPSAPTVKTPVYDTATGITAVTAEDTLSGIGSTAADDADFKAVSGVYITTDGTALDAVIDDPAALSGVTKLSERADTPGAFDTQELEDNFYYIFAVDGAGNVAPKQKVVADKTPPLIDNVSFTDLGAGKWRIAFTVTDAVAGFEDAEVKWSANKTSFTSVAQKDPDIADGYYFEVTADVQNVPHYVQATDKNGNVAMREVYDEKNVINVSVPMKLMFASFPNVFGAEFTAPVYTVTNNSSIVKTRLSVSAFDADPANGFTLAAPGATLTPDTLTLYMQGVQNEKATAFNGMGKFNLMPGAAFGDVKKMGTLAVKPDAGDDPASRGMFTYAGDVFGYAPGSVPTLRGSFTTTLKFENVRFGE